MTRTPVLGLPVVCAAGVLVVGMAAAARHVLDDLTSGTGVPDVGLLGIMFFGMFVLPAVALSIACLGLALSGTWQLRAGRTELASTAAWMTLVGGGGLTQFSATTQLQALGGAAVALSLVGLVTFEAASRPARPAGTTST